MIALVAFAQWLLAAPQLADAALLVALYWVALDGELGRGCACRRHRRAGRRDGGGPLVPSEPLKVWVGLTGLATAAAVLGVSIRQRRALLASLHEKAARLEFERDQEGRLGAAAERARIAREMHDIVAHNLTVMIALADGATYAMDSLAGARDRGDSARLCDRPPGAARDAPTARRAARGASEHPLEPQPSLDRLDDLWRGSMPRGSR